MLIYDTSTGQLREMTEEEEYTAEHLPNPEDMAGAEEIVSILTGESE